MKYNKIVLIFLCMLIAIIIGGCSKEFEQENADIDTENIEITEGTVKSEDTAITESIETYDISYEDYYKEILDNYYEALCDKENMEQVSNYLINYLYTYVESEENNRLMDVGYYISDIDGNGIPELLIGNLSDDSFLKDMVFEVYTLVDDKPELIFSGMERNRYYLRSDGKFANEGSSGASYSDWYIFEIAEDGKTLNVIEGVRTDTPDINDYFTINWYSTKDLDYDCTNDELISEDEARQILQQYKNMYTAVPYVSFSEYQYLEKLLK